MTHLLRAVYFPTEQKESERLSFIKAIPLISSHRHPHTRAFGFFQTQLRSNIDVKCCTQLLAASPHIARVTGVGSERGREREREREVGV